jgi:N-ethylmaleimide reductase
MRFVLEVLDGMIAAAGTAARVGIKIAPAMQFNDCEDDNPVALYTTFVKELSAKGLAFLHVLQSPGLPNVFELLRPLYKGTFAAVGGFTRESGTAALASRLADFIVFGKLFIANPDLPFRFANGLSLNEWDASTFYQGGAKGYIDYPAASTSLA